MPQYEIVNGWRVVFYFNDHNPPHFHAVKNENAVRVFLEEDIRIEVTGGKLTGSEKRVLFDYTTRKLDELKEFWNELQS